MPYNKFVKQQLTDGYILLKRDTKHQIYTNQECNITETFQYKI